jgi:hypothetical protein
VPELIEDVWQVVGRHPNPLVADAQDRHGWGRYVGIGWLSAQRQREAAAPRAELEGVAQQVVWRSRSGGSAGVFDGVL